MNAHAPSSSMGWLDFDETSRERVAALLRSLEEPGTLDPLGLSSVRDAFSEMLSPGTSTIQTRLRYFVSFPGSFAASNEIGSGRPTSPVASGIARRG